MIPCARGHEVEREALVCRRRCDRSGKRGSETEYHEGKQPQHAEPPVKRVKSDPAWLNAHAPTRRRGAEVRRSTADLSVLASKKTQDNDSTQ